MPEHPLHYKLLYRWVGRDNEVEKSDEDRRKPEQLKPFRLRPLSNGQRDWYFERIQEVFHP